LDAMPGRPRRSIDCSGLVRNVFGVVFPESGIGSRSDLNALKFCTELLFKNTTDPLPGDIICWIDHVGLVVNPEERRIIHAPREGETVRYEDWKNMKKANPLFRC
jgi:cell wall-associated NlpC family hydrolase